MTQQERDAVGIELSRAAIFYDRSDLDKTKISMMIDVINDAYPECDASQILKAIKNYRDDHKNSIFPSPAKLNQYLRPKVLIDAQANEIVSRIVQSISRFGYTGHKQASAFVGEIGWGVVRRLGGWEYLCREHGESINPGQFYAQTRELVKAQLEIQNSPNIDMELLLNGPGPETKQLPEPIKFTESETQKIYELAQGKSKQELDQLIDVLVKEKQLKQEVGA